MGSGFRRAFTAGNDSSDFQYYGAIGFDRVESLRFFEEKKKKRRKKGGEDGQIGRRTVLLSIVDYVVSL